jgi:hypothetical protein
MAHLVSVDADEPGPGSITIPQDPGMSGSVGETGEPTLASRQIFRRLISALELQVLIGDGRDPGGTDLGIFEGGWADVVGLRPLQPTALAVKIEGLLDLGHDPPVILRLSEGRGDRQ